ncbi:hypothetical protein [Mucilaginibacter auburnensis]|uniref:VWFA domain-containing protein n=1 Tax=Mucilaginibacter auburnensis TaxID=1457233 RepID=A0A2H9VRU8_9SPHI|nr:hypothetical protein [Mucilaginibacter auburnensis]PJJ83519.1 hypothetical protein CLV57_0502 [Mucilaginibacter auburnensis]
MPKLYSFLAGLYVVTASLFFMSCDTPDTDKDGLNDEVDKCVDQYAKTKNGCPIKREVKNVHLYIETSASMGGYFRNDAEFKTVVTDLASKVNGEIKPVDIWFIADTTVKYNGTVENFSHDIATTQIADKKSSQLHKIFADVAANTNPDDISFIVSDCILSFSNEDIKQNPEINKTEANNAMRQGIYSTFLKLKNNNQAVGVYSFRSKFYGDYYDYQNTKTSLHGNSRPYYIWAIGNRDVLKGFIDRLTQISTFLPEKSLYFGLAGEPVKQYSILTQVDKSGTWNLEENNKLEDVETTSNGTLSFCTGLNLDNLPPYAKDIAYLQKNLQITTDGCVASLTVKPKQSINTDKIKGKLQNDLFKNSTHFVVISVSKINVDNASIQLRLPVKHDMWYENWSTDDDKNIASENEGKTFAFKYLINGVNEAYETRTKNYIDISIPLSK